VTDEEDVDNTFEVTSLSEDYDSVGLPVRVLRRAERSPVPVIVAGVA
jgi:hypothetical protein